jgi:hypothetical protein
MDDILIVKKDKVSGRWEIARESGKPMAGR